MPLDKFEWDEKTKTFSTNENGLAIDFRNISDCTFKTGWSCTFTTGGYCTFDTCGDCTFKTSWGGTFTTGDDCTFKTGDDCTFTTGWSCTFKTLNNCVVVRRDVFEVIIPKKGQKTQLNPYNISGYLAEVDGKMYPSGDTSQGEHIIIDGILSKVISRKGNVIKVINHEEDKQTYIVSDGDKHAHGKTLKEARDSLIYKLSNRDTSKFKEWELDRKITFAEAIESYRAITGACEEGTRGFVKNTKIPKKLTVSDVIEITKGQFGNEIYKQFFNKE